MLKKKRIRPGKGPTIVLGIIHQGDKVLIIKRRQKDPLVKNLIWAFPGGKLHIDETPEESLLREIKEEVGISIKIKGLIFIRVYPGTQILQRFYDCVPLGPTRLVISEPDEVEEARWVKANQVQEYFASNVHPFIVGFLNGIASQNKIEREDKMKPRFEG